MRSLEAALEFMVVEGSCTSVLNPQKLDSQTLHLESQMVFLLPDC